MKAVIGVGLAIAMAVVACGGDDDSDDVGATVPPGSPTTTAEEQEEEAPGDDAAMQYFELLATNDLSRMGGMLELAAEGSPAHAYATHQIAMVRADPFLLATPTSSVWSDGSVEQCSESFTETGDTVQDCYTFGDFELDNDGLLVDFTVNGASIGERLSTAEPVEAQGVAVRVVTAYETARGDLVLNVDVTNNLAGPLSLAEYEWVFTTADGRQVEVDPMVTGLTSDIGPGATAATAVVFLQTPNAGGMLRFVAYADDFATEVRFDVPVPAGGLGG